MKPGRNWWRWLTLIAAAALASQPQTAAWLASLSPHLVAAGSLASKTVGAAALLGLPVLVFALLSPRWFCRNACPTGFLLDLLARRDVATPRHWPPVGKWLLAATLGGAALGYPIFLWLDPLALFTGFLNAWHKPISLAAGLVLPAILVFNYFAPRVWCRRICPLGAMQELLALPRRHRAAPMPSPHAQRLARRAFLGVCAGAAGAALIKVAHGRATPPLRPPGALAEEEFVGVCVRCGGCGRVCPSHIIRQDLRGVAGWLAPRLRFEDDYCREDCCRCGAVCPSGAIAKLSLPEKRRRVIGTAKVDLEACLLANGQECTQCINRCPFEAITISEGVGSESPRPLVNAVRCNGCGACEAVCPAWPKVAIRVAATEPKHRESV